MYKILHKKRLNAESVLMDIEAPLIAQKAKPGQFIIFRVDKSGERVPLTISSCNRQTGAVRVIFQTVGRSTLALGELEAGDTIADFVGPLGKASELEELSGKEVAVIGGGLGAAIAFPVAVSLHELNANVDMIVGFRNKDIIILEDEMRASSTRLFVTTDDGSNGVKGFVTEVLRTQLEAGKHYDHIIAIGPVPMMKACCELSKHYNIPTTVSMNAIMVDGTGMCGCCRLTVGGKMVFACVDGPDFDGHQVDFANAMSRSRIYREQEMQDKERHICNLTGEVRNEH